jgi:hypothetical protein
MPLALTFRLRDIIDHGGIAAGIAVLVVVVVAVALMILLVRGLPGMLAFLARSPGGLQEASHHGTQSIRDEDVPIDRDIAVAIATVLEHELTPEDGSAIQRITIRRGPEENLWRNAYRIRSLVSKSHPPTARK